MNAADLSKTRTVRLGFLKHCLAIEVLLAAITGCGAPPEEEQEVTSGEALVSESSPEAALAVDAVGPPKSPCVWGFNNSKPLYTACAYFPPLTPFLYQNRYHSFAIGSDYQVWHAWQINVGGTAYSDWTSLGGTARSQVSVWLLADLSLYAKVLGTDGHNWCRYYNRPSARGKWDAGWAHC